MSLRKGIVTGVMIAVLAGLLGVPPVVWAQDIQEPTGTEITLDLIIARPIGAMGLALGTSIFIVSLPFAVATGSAKTTADKLVAEPYHFTFVRDLGDY